MLSNSGFIATSGHRAPFKAVILLMEEILHHLKS